MAVTSLLPVVDRLVKATLEETLKDADVAYHVWFEEMCYEGDSEEEPEHRVPIVSIYVAMTMPKRPDTPAMTGVATASWGLPVEEAMDPAALQANVREKAEHLLFQRTMYLEDDVASLVGNGEEPPAP